MVTRGSRTRATRSAAATANEETRLRSHPTVDAPLTHAEVVEGVVRASDLLPADARRRLEQDQRDAEPLYVGYHHAWMMAGQLYGYADTDQ